MEFGLDPKKQKLEIVAQEHNTCFVIKLVGVPYPRDVQFIQKLKAAAQKGQPGSIEMLNLMEKEHWKPAECGFVYTRGEPYRSAITNIGVPFKFMPYLEDAKGNEFTQEELQQILALPILEEYQRQQATRSPAK